MDWAVIVGVLTLVVAAGGLAWQMFSRRIRLKLEIDHERSGFVTVRVQQAGLDAEEEIRTGLRIVVSVSNVSVRPNTVVDIEPQIPAQHESLPDNARFVTGIREVPNPVYTTMTDRIPSFWEIPPAWNLPHRLPPGDRHEAGFAFLLADGPRPPDTELRVGVTVTDTYGRRYRTSARLKHD